MCEIESMTRGKCLGSQHVLINTIHSQVLQTKVVQSKGLGVCNGWVLESLDLLNRCYQSSPEVCPNSGSDYRVATLSKLYQTATGIIGPTSNVGVSNEGVSNEGVSNEGVSNEGVIKRRSGSNVGVFKRRSHHCLSKTSVPIFY